MFRAVFLLVLALIAGVAIDPIWNSQEHQLTLRVRGPAEMFVIARERVRQLGELVRSTREDKPSAESESARGKPQSGEALTPEERRALQKLVQETTRGD